MPEKHREIVFEQELVAHLISHGWLEGDAAGYDRELALYPEDVAGWLRETQTEEWDKLAGQPGQPGGGAERRLLRRLAEVMDKERSLAALRHGFKHGSALPDVPVPAGARVQPYHARPL